jgi:S1-C subfamily serine protease
MPNIAMPSVQSLLIQMFVRDQSLSIGTGFIASRGGAMYLVTNRHNLAGRRSDTNELMSPKTGAVPDTVAIAHNAAEGLGVWTPTTEALYDADDRPLWFEHPVHGRAVDVVALPLQVSPEVAYYAYHLDQPDLEIKISVSTDVSVVGFPFGVTSGGFVAVWTRGTIASEYELPFDNLPCFLIDARTRQGQSGSPVIFHSAGGLVQTNDGASTLMGEVDQLLGIYSGRINSESDLGMVWRVDALREIIDAGERPSSN